MYRGSLRYLIFALLYLMETLFYCEWGKTFFWRFFKLKVVDRIYHDIPRTRKHVANILCQQPPPPPPASPNGTIHVCNKTRSVDESDVPPALPSLHFVSPQNCLSAWLCPFIDQNYTFLCVWMVVGFSTFSQRISFFVLFLWKTGENLLEVSLCLRSISLVCLSARGGGGGGGRDRERERERERERVHPTTESSVFFRDWQCCFR